MIHAEGVSLSYAAASPVLDRVHLTAPAGQFVSLVGPSGCGKSTLLRLIAGLLTPTTGTVTVDGHPPCLGKGAPPVGFVFQDPTLLPWRSVVENIRLPLELGGAPTAEVDRAVRESLELVGLSPADGTKFPRMLSGGMRMRVSLARVLVRPSPVWLFDEPFAALDDILRQQLNEELLAIWARRRPTVLFVTHNISEAIFLSQRVLFMSRRPGTIVGELPVELVHPRVRSVRSTPEFASLLGRAASLLEKAAGASSAAAAETHS